MRMLAALAAAGMLVSGCSIVDRVIGDPEVPELSESSLDRLLLSSGEINTIVDGPGMEAETRTSDELASGPANISDEDCLGTVFPAQKPVYSGSGWIATLRGNVVDSEGSHGVNQAVVLFRSADRAQEFFEESRNTFETCAGEELLIAAGTEDEHTVEIGEFVTAEGDRTLLVHDLDKVDGALDCQHAMGVVSNLIAEAEVCFADNAASDEAETVVTRILQNAENQAANETAADG